MFESPKMTERAGTRTCGMCRMEIAADAKKCPYCQHFQNKLSMVIFHPAFGVFFATIPGVVALIVLSTMLRGLLDQGEDFQRYADEITVSDTAMKFGEINGVQTVAVVGRMKNGSSLDWKEVHFHVEFRDANGILIDVGQEFDYSYYLPAHEEAGFKVSFRREFPEASYFSHTVRVIEAKDGRAGF